VQEKVPIKQPSKDKAAACLNIFQTSDSPYVTFFTFLYPLTVKNYPVENKVKRMVSFFSPLGILANVVEPHSQSLYYIKAGF